MIFSGRIIASILFCLIFHNIVITAQDTLTLKWTPSYTKDKVWSIREIDKLQNEDLKEEIDVFVLDGFDTEKSDVKRITDYYEDKYNKDIKLVAYFSGGSMEDWRPDTSEFYVENKIVLGNKMEEWSDERITEYWLDVRRLDVLIPIMAARVEIAASKGFHGVEFDNVDGFLLDENGKKTKFGIKPEEQLRYNKALAAVCHEKGLAVGLKNDMEQIEDLHSFFDFAMNEELYKEGDDISLYKTYFIDNNKPVVNVEYKGKLNKICARSEKIGIFSMRKKDYFKGKERRCW